MVSTRFKNKKMAQVVLHVEKGSSSGGSLGNHIDRIPGYEHTFENADPKLKHLNKNLEVNKYCKMNFNSAISSRIGDGYKSNRKIRTDAVKFCKVILSGSHEKMKEIQKDPEELRKWSQKNYDFAAEQWGGENIIRFSLHLDEKTPHIHCVFVPITDDGRLSAKEVLGKRKDFVNLQDKYAEQMKEFGLERGLKGSKAKHETVNEFYGRIERESKPEENTKIDIEEVVLKPSRVDLLNPGAFYDKSKEKAEKELKKLLDAKQIEIHRLQNDKRSLQKELGKVKGNYYKLVKDLGDLNKVPFSLKTEDGKVKFILQGEKIEVPFEPIQKELSIIIFNTSLKQLPEKIATHVINAKYHQLLKEVDLLESSPKDIINYAQAGVTSFLKHQDTVSYKVQGENVNIAFSFGKKDDKIFVNLSYTDLNGKDQVKSIPIKRNEIDLFEDLKESLETKQNELKKKIQPKKRRGPSLG